MAAEDWTCPTCGSHDTQRVSVLKALSTGSISLKGGSVGAGIIGRTIGAAEMETTLAGSSESNLTHLLPPEPSYPLPELKFGDSLRFYILSDVKRDPVQELRARQWAEEHEQWGRQALCLRCGKVFMPPEPEPESELAPEEEKFLPVMEIPKQPLSLADAPGSDGDWAPGLPNSKYTSAEVRDHYRKIAILILAVCLVGVLSWMVGR